mmetsp:Transcript_75652/g.162257  ORF Transcript_75652/g.162257 Transcript_75652/m.162257 type:complete len:346 (+) Transcript_75652:67-1104(+)
MIRENGEENESDGSTNGLPPPGQLLTGICSWTLCSIGMLVFNKLAIKAFPVACSLVALQFGFSVLAMIVCCWRSIHIGSAYDVLRWSMVVPFFTGMILSSILALEYAPMTLVITFRALSPVISCVIERFYPKPLTVSYSMLVSMGAMLVGVAFYIHDMDRSRMAGVGWALLNNFLAIGDRLLQRLMLGSDQDPVDISKTGVTLLNNLLGCVPLLIAAFFTSEFGKIPAAVADLDTVGVTWVVCSCLVGVGISYTGIWVQSLISATSFLVLVNANKFAIIFIEAFVMHEKSLTPTQIIGASISIIAGIAYGKAREQVEARGYESWSDEEDDEDVDGDDGEVFIASK